MFLPAVSLRNFSRTALTAVAVLTMSVSLPGTGFGAQARYLTFTPSVANFGNVGIGTTSQPISITIFNGSKFAAHYISSTNLDNFNIDPGTCGPINLQATLPPGASCTFTATFQPTAMGLVIGSITLGAGPQVVKFQFKGNGVTSRLTFSRQPLNFGNVAVGSTSAFINVTVTNLTSAPATYKSEFGLRNFIINGGTCGPINPSTTLAPGATCTFNIAFSPKTVGYHTGGFTLNTGSGPATFTASGSGK